MAWKKKWICDLRDHTSVNTISLQRIHNLTSLQRTHKFTGHSHRYRASRRQEDVVVVAHVDGPLVDAIEDVATYTEPAGFDTAANRLSVVGIAVQERAFQTLWPIDSALADHGLGDIAVDEYAINAFASVQRAVDERAVTERAFLERQATAHAVIDRAFLERQATARVVNDTKHLFTVQPLVRGLQIDTSLGGGGC